MNAIVPAGGNTALTPTNMESAIQLAEMMARGKLVPQHLHNSPGDCLMVIEASMRWQMSPFAVAQCTSVIQGKLMFEGKLVAAALNASGILSSRLDYDFSGEGAQRAVTVRGRLRGETKDREVTVFLEDAKTSNGMWTKQPDQQLVYAGTRVWARRHAPEVMLGVYAPEEFDRAEPFDGQTIEHAASDERSAINDAVPLKPAAAVTPRGKRKVDPNVYETPPKSTPPTDGKPRHSVAPPPGAPDVDWRACLDWVAPAMAKLRTRQHVVDVANGPTCSDIIAHGPGWAKAELDELLNENYRRFPDEPEGEELPEVEIAGAEKVGAG